MVRSSSEIRGESCSWPGNCRLDLSVSAMKVVDKQGAAGSITFVIVSGISLRTTMG